MGIGSTTLKKLLGINGVCKNHYSRVEPLQFEVNAQENEIFNYIDIDNNMEKPANDLYQS
jgi:hypothetical protein